MNSDASSEASTCQFFCVPRVWIVAKALGVEAQDLVEGGETAELNVAAVLGPRGAEAPRRRAIVVPPRVDGGQVAILVAAGVGETFQDGLAIAAAAIDDGAAGAVLVRLVEFSNAVPA